MSALDPRGVSPGVFPAAPSALRAEYAPHPQNLKGNT